MFLKENQDLQYDLENVYAKIARIRKRKRSVT